MKRAEVVVLGVRAAGEQEQQEPQAGHQEEDLDPAAHPDLPFVIALEEGEGEGSGKQEDPDDAAQAQEVDGPQRARQLLFLRIVEPGAEPREAVACEAHVDPVGAGRQRMDAVGIADGQVGASGELLAADLGLAIAGAVDPLASQEGFGPLPRLRLGDRGHLDLRVEAQPHP
jgi:hypothetical protein